MSNWRKYAKVCSVHGYASHYVEYRKGDTILRLTTRGTWSSDDGDIYWPSRGCAYYQLEQASEPMTDMQRNLDKLKRLLDNTDLPFEWSADGFQFDGYLCPEYMAAALNAVPLMMEVVEAAQDWHIATTTEQSCLAVVNLGKALAAFNAAKIGGDE